MIAAHLAKKLVSYLILSKSLLITHLFRLLIELLRLEHGIINK